MMELTSKQKDILETPIFIIGAPRSGTTWLQKLFLSHRGVVGGQESNFFDMANYLFQAIEPKTARNVGLHSYWAGREQDFESLIKGIWIETFAPYIESDTDILVEKTPGNCFHINTIKRLLPKSKFIHIIRDSRSVCASMISASNSWGNDWAPKTAKDASILWWRSVYNAQIALSQIDSSDYIECRYESLLFQTTNELKRLYEFAGLSFDEKLISEVVESQSFTKQKQSSDSLIQDITGKSLVEPKDFIRKGETDSWKKELTFYQKLTVWIYTRRLMKQLGYKI